MNYFFINRIDFMASTRRNQRGNSLVVAMVFVAGATIAIAGVMNGMTSSRIVNEQAAADSELMYAGIGFLHLLRADMSDDGQIGNELSAYDMNGANNVYVLDAEWEAERFASINLQYRLAAGPGSGETTVTAHASRTYGNSLRAIEVSVVIKQSGDLPYDGWFGNNLTVSSGLRTFTPFGIRGNVTGVVLSSSDITHNETVSVSGTYVVGATIANVETGADVPSVTFDIATMISELTADPNVNVSTYAAGNFAGSGNGNSTPKGIKLRFDPSKPGKVYVSTTNANINAVNQPFSNETLTNLSLGADGAVLVLDDFQNVVVEGTYTDAITIVARNGAITVGGTLKPNSSNTPAIGLVAGSSTTGTHEGNVYVRLKKNNNDFGFSSNSTGEIEARIYAQKQFTSFANNTTRMSSLTVKTMLIANGGGTDLGAVATTRNFYGPTNGDITSPGMNAERIVASGGKPQFKSGSWGFNFNP